MGGGKREEEFGVSTFVGAWKNTSVDIHFRDSCFDLNSSCRFGKSIAKIISLVYMTFSVIRYVKSYSIIEQEIAC